MGKWVTQVLAWLALLLAAGNASAESPRLTLWITEPVGATNAAHCHAIAPRIPPGPPDITEHDVTGWDPESAAWILDPNRLSETARMPADRCFVLALDGKIISGVILSTHSARLIRFPTLAVDTRKCMLSWRLTSGHGGAAFPLEHELLDRILKAQTTVIGATLTARCWPKP